MYTIKNYKTKKALIEDFKKGIKIKVFQPNSFFSSARTSDSEVIEGPHYPEPHRFYVSVEIENGIITRIKK